jgi:hypothetical protein
LNTIVATARKPSAPKTPPPIPTPKTTARSIPSDSLLWGSVEAGGPPVPLVGVAPESLGGAVFRLSVVVVRLVVGPMLFSPMTVYVVPGVAMNIFRFEAVQQEPSAASSALVAQQYVPSKQSAMYAALVGLTLIS